jgi:hypothetical protein
MIHKLQFTTSYHQFYLCDKDYIGDTGSFDFWTDNSFADKLAIETGILGVSIGTYGHVNTTISILDQRNEKPDLALYDHVVEASLEITSGILQVLDCPNSNVELELNVPPGFYRVRVSAAGLDSIVDEDEEAEDTYHIEIWPEEPSASQVLKRASFNW